MKKNSLLLFFLMAAANLISISFDIEAGEKISKSLLMPALATYFAFRWQGEKDNGFFLTIAALSFSWIGDLLLMFQDRIADMFLYGIVAFLLAHIVYIFDYYTLQVKTDNKPNNIFISSRILILAFVGGAMLNVLWPKLGEMKIPIIIYTAVIILMAVFAVLRREQTSPNSFSFIYGGALLFIVSDGMIAVSKYLEPFAYHDLLIMTCYIFAQFFIVKGVLEHNKFLLEPSKE